MRARVFLAVVIALLVMPAVAHAKGPDQATVTGKGMTAPLSVTGREGAEGDLSTLVELAGLFPAVFAQTPDPMLAAAPDEVLGPKLVITWRLPNGGPTPSTVSQDLYLYASGGPLTYTAPAQVFFSTEHTTGGWFRTPAALQSRWTSFGLPTKAALEAAAHPKPASTPVARTREPDVVPWLGFASAAAAAVAVVCIVAMTASRVTSRRRVHIGST